MGSPLSPVGACLYIEDLERSRLLDIMGPDSEWMRYVDDVLVVVPQDIDLDEKLSLLNAVNPKIQFTLEKEQDAQIPFLDTSTLRTENFIFKVFRKPTNKEDYVHFYSAHADRVKSGIVIGFFLRALEKICDDDYLQEEIQHIYQTFERLKYPKGFLIQQRKKAEEIIKKKQT